MVLSCHRGRLVDLLAYQSATDGERSKHRGWGAGLGASRNGLWPDRRSFNRCHSPRPLAAGLHPLLPNRLANDHGGR